jgi:HPt (histidine-containing phosphotransfer) domain-containing protein
LAEGRAVATAQRLQLAAVRNDTLEATQELVRAAPTLAAAAAAAGPQQQQQEQEETEEGLQQQVGEIEVRRVACSCSTKKRTNQVKRGLQRGVG